MDAEAHERALTALFMELKCVKGYAAGLAVGARGARPAHCFGRASPGLAQLAHLLSLCCLASKRVSPGLRRSGMRNVDRETDPETALRSLKDLGGKMTECKR